MVVPAVSKRMGKDKYKLVRSILPFGAIVHARINEGKNLDMQAHYKARVIRAWPGKRSDAGRKKSDDESELVALHFIDSRIVDKLPPQRKGKPPASHYVEPNDVVECRVELKPPMITQGYVEKNKKVSARYLFHGKRVNGWSGFYPAIVTEQCEDGTVLIKYMHENPKHEEYLKCNQIQLPILRGDDH
jgi:hypothetical protein